MEFRGYQSHVRRARCRRSTTRRCSSATTRSTGCSPRPARPTRTTGSSPPTSCASSCSACCARSSPSTAGRRGRCTRPPRVLFEAPTVAERRARLGRPAARCASTPPTRRPPGCASVCRSTTRRSGSRCSSRRPSSPSRCSWRRPAPRSRPASPSVVDDAVDATARRRPVGVAGGLAVAAWPRWPAATTAAAPDARSTPSTARCPASSRPSSRSRWPARRGGERDVAEELYADLRAHRRQLHRPGGVRPGPDPRRRAATSTGRVARARPGAADQPRRTPRPGAGGPGCSPSRAAACPRSPQAMDSIDGRHASTRVDRAALTARVLERGARRGRRRAAPRPDVRDRRHAGRASRPLRDGLEAAYRELAALTPTTATERVRLVDQANAVRRWTLRDAMTAADAAPSRRCPALRRVPDGEREQFCEACGADARRRAAARPRPPTTPTAAPTGARPATRRPRHRPAPRRRAPRAAARSTPTATATTCGTKAPSARDHFTEQPAPWVAGVCDRGIRHARNEDAMAVAADAEPGTARRARRLRRRVQLAPTPTSRQPRRAPAPPATCCAAAAPARPGHAERPGRALVAAALDGGGRRGQRRGHRGHRAGRPPTRRRAPSSPPSLDGRRCVVVGWRRRQPRLLAARRRRRASAAHRRRLVGRRADRRTACPRARGRDRPAGARDHPLARHATRPTTRRGRRRSTRRPARAGCWSAPTGCGTTAPRRRDLADLVGRPRRRAAASRWRSPARWSTGPTPRAARTTSPSRSPASAPSDRRRSRPDRDRTERKPPMAEFTAEVFQNEFLPDGGTDVHAIVTVTCTGAGDGRAAGRGRRRPRSSSSTPRARWARDEDRGRQAGRAGGARPDRRRHLVRGDRRQPRGPPAPIPPTAGAGDGADGRRAPAPRPSAAVASFRADGGTAMGTWLDLAARVFATVPGADPAARDPAHRRREPARDARGSSTAAIDGRTGPVPVRLPRRRRRLGGRPSSAGSPRRCSARRHHRRARADGRRLRAA